MDNSLTIQSNQVAPSNQWTPEQLQLLKDTVAKDTTNDEFKVFCYAVQRTGLDPFVKQIYAVKRNGTVTVQVGIDGFRLIAHRTGQFAGNDEIIFDNELSPKKAIARVYRLVNGVRCAFTGVARWSEYYPGDKLGFMWKKMPCVMLGKVAESIALRMAFPAELSGLYTKEEMHQAEQQEEVKPPVAKTPSDKNERIFVMGKIANLMEDLAMTTVEVKELAYKLIGRDNAELMSVDELKIIVVTLEHELKMTHSSVQTAIPDEQEWLKAAQGGPVGT